jgi:peroxidase
MATRIITSFAVILVLLGTICDAQLSSTFYDSTCPNGLNTIRTAIRTAISKERRMAASLIRLHFHDCFVQVHLFIFDNSHVTNNFRYKFAKWEIG